MVKPNARIPQSEQAAALRHKITPAIRQVFNEALNHEFITEADLGGYIDAGDPQDLTVSIYQGPNSQRALHYRVLWAESNHDAHVTYRQACLFATGAKTCYRPISKLKNVCVLEAWVLMAALFKDYEMPKVDLFTRFQTGVEERIGAYRSRMRLDASKAISISSG